MKPDRKLRLCHTQNDTQPIAVHCQIKENGTTSDVPNGDTVTLHITQSVSPFTVTGTPQGGGVFHFAIDNSIEIGLADCEIQVDNGTTVMTIAKGTINVETEIA